MDAALPEGWAAYTDGEGRTYYANAATGETSWEPPAPPALPLPTGWTAHQDQEGRTFYAHENGTTQWELPAEAPTGTWSLDQAQDVGAECEMEALAALAQLLDTNVHYSVQATVDQLNSGEIAVEAGYCLIFSRRKERFYLLWRDDKQDVALPLFGIGDWSQDLAYDIGEVGEDTERLFRDRAQYLDPSVYTGVRQAVDALNAGQIQVPAGYCVIFSQNNGRYFLLWRNGFQNAALTALALTLE